MKLEFNYFIPTRIIFGAGKLKELATTRYLPGKKALIVISSGASMKRQGYLDRVIGYLNERGVQSIVFDKILPNPVVEHVAEGAALAKQEGCDFVIGLGGAFGAWLAGKIFDVTGSYNGAFITGAAAALGSIVVVTLLKRQDRGGENGHSTRE